MNRSLAQRRVFASELRDVVFRACSALGLLSGMWWMVNNPVTSEACVDPPAQRVDATVITDCAEQTILASALHYGTAIGGGLVVGALLGLLLTRLIPVPSSQRVARIRRPPRPAPATAADAGLAGRWITARYAGRCAECAALVRPGDRILHRPRRVACAACAGRLKGAAGSSR